MTPLSDAIAGLKATLETAAGLSSVRVLDRPPLTSDETTAPDGSFEVVFVDQNFDVSREVPTMRAGLIELEEVWSIPVVVQVLCEQDELVDALDRLQTLQYAAINAVQNTPGLGVTGYRRFEAIYRDGRIHTGPLNEGFGCRSTDTVEVTVRVDA